MRVLLFRGGIKSLNHFVDHTYAYLKEAGCETFICTLPLVKKEETGLENFLIGGVHAVIVYDGIGMYLKEIYDRLGIPVVNILMDHPMTFAHCMSKPPQKYIQFSPDEDHAAFSKKCWDVENSFFFPTWERHRFSVEENVRLDFCFQGHIHRRRTYC